MKFFPGGLRDWNPLILWLLSCGHCDINQSVRCYLFIPTNGRVGTRENSAWASKQQTIGYFPIWSSESRTRRGASWPGILQTVAFKESVKAGFKVCISTELFLEVGWFTLTENYSQVEPGNESHPSPSTLRPTPYRLISSKTGQYFGII